jgi:NAD(P)-dependent dehydrogenase (short-subunit alcohol dehydrogenase family)
LAARRGDRIDALEEQLAQRGAEVFAVRCDVSDEVAVDRLVAATLERFGALDILVNNAGITEIVKAEDEPLETFRRVLDVNLIGAFLCAQRCARPMLAAGKGAIVNVASVLGIVGTGQIPQASYTASKGGLVNLTRELAAQWARRGVRVNALAPAWFASEMTGDMFRDEQQLEWTDRTAALPGLGCRQLRHGPGPARRWRLDHRLTTEMVAATPATPARTKVAAAEMPRTSPRGLNRRARSAARRG